jgi:hypothetical protein
VHVNTFRKDGFIYFRILLDASVPALTATAFVKVGQLELVPECLAPLTIRIDADALEEGAVDVNVFAKPDSDAVATLADGITVYGSPKDPVYLVSPVSVVLVPVDAPKAHPTQVFAVRGVKSADVSLTVDDAEPYYLEASEHDGTLYLSVAFTPCDNCLHTSSLLAIGVAGGGGADDISFLVEYVQEPKISRVKPRKYDTEATVPLAIMVTLDDAYTDTYPLTLGVSEGVLSDVKYDTKARTLAAKYSCLRCKDGYAILTTSLPLVRPSEVARQGPALELAHDAPPTPSGGPSNQEIALYVGIGVGAALFVAIVITLLVRRARAKRRQNEALAFQEHLYASHYGRSDHGYLPA